MEWLGDEIDIGGPLSTLPKERMVLQSIFPLYLPPVVFWAPPVALQALPIELQVPPVTLHRGGKNDSFVDQMLERGREVEEDDDNSDDALLSVVTFVMVVAA